MGSRRRVIGIPANGRASRPKSPVPCRKRCWPDRRHRHRDIGCQRWRAGTPPARDLLGLRNGLPHPRIDLRPREDKQQNDGQRHDASHVAVRQESVSSVARLRQIAAPPFMNPSIFSARFLHAQPLASQILNGGFGKRRVSSRSLPTSIVSTSAQALEDRQQPLRNRGHMRNAITKNNPRR